MGVYYPQAVMTLRVLWEDFGLKSDAAIQEVYSLPILARRLTVDINDYTQADTFDAEIDYKSFPFDPRSIRACAVTIHMEDRKQIFKGNNTLNLLEPSAENTLFQGFVDEESIQFDDDKRTVKFEGRDFTAILIDTKYLEGKPIDMKTPLDVLLGQLLAGVKSTQEITIDNRTGTTLPTLAQFYPDFGHPLAGQKNTEKDDSYWDIIQNIVTKAGLIAFIELDKLVVTTPRLLHNKDNAKKFVYGCNIRNLNFKRKLGRQKGFNIRVRYLDLATKTVSTCDIPEQASDAFIARTQLPKKRIQIPQVMPNGELGPPKDAPFMTFRVTNVKNEDQLKQIAEKIFEEISLQQLEGSFDTYEMRTFDEAKQPKSFDILKLRNGTPIRVEVDQGDLQGFNKKSTIPARTAFLISRGYNPKIARALATTHGKFETVFYTKSVRYSMDSDSGFKAAVNFINFIDLDARSLGIG